MFEYFINIPREIYAQILGFIAMGIALTGYVQKNDKNTIRIVMGSSVFWIFHFMVLGVYSAMVAAMISLARLFLSLKYKKNKRIFLGVIAVTLIMGIVTYTDHISLLPIMGSCVSAYGYFFYERIKLRMFMIVSSFFWLTFNLNIGSASGIINDSLVQTILIITMIKMIKDEHDRTYFVDKIMDLVEKRRDLHLPDLGRYIHISDYIKVTGKLINKLSNKYKVFFKKLYKKYINKMRNKLDEIVN